MKRLTQTVVVFAVLLLAAATAFATGPQGESGPKGPDSLTEKGWMCFADESIGMWAHCAPPGEETLLFPPVLRALNFATFDVTEDAEFMGTEHAIRDDLFHGQPCPQGIHTDGSTPRTREPFNFGPGTPTYWSCHHFNDLSALP